MTSTRLFLIGCLSTIVGVVISVNIIDAVKQHYKTKKLEEEARSNAYHNEMMHERKMRSIQRFGEEAAEEVAAEAELKQSLEEAEAEWRKDPTRGWDDMPTLEKLRQQKSVK